MTKEIRQARKIISEMKKNSKSLSDEMLIEQWENDLFFLEDEQREKKNELNKALKFMAEES